MGRDEKRFKKRAILVPTRDADGTATPTEYYLIYCIRCSASFTHLFFYVTYFINEL